jgi:cell division septum initiation protein DivIVA
VTSDRFQRPLTPAGARAAASVPVSDLPPHPPDVRDAEVDALMEAEFPLALRGYDRTAVDAYVQRASRVIEELRASSSPQAAVRYALEQVSEQTRSILQQAHDSADAMGTQSRTQAADLLDSAKREAAELLESARRESTELRTSAERDSTAMLADAERESAAMRAAGERDAIDLRSTADHRVHEAEDELADIWQERQRLIEDAREIAARLAEIADVAAEREAPPVIALTEDDTAALPPAPTWDDDVEDEDDGAFPQPMAQPALHAVPPPPDQAAPEPSLADAPPPPSESPGALAFELRDEPELGPLDEPAAGAAVEEAAVPQGDTVEFPRPDVAPGRDR